jgi:hypothetical protein
MFGKDTPCFSKLRPNERMQNRLGRERPNSIAKFRQDVLKATMRLAGNLQHHGI